jgi:small conductance mechanosensitive channel
VEEITFHAVRLRDYSGQVIFVPCGSISTIVNKSMGFAQAVIDVGVAYREDADQALAVMRRVAQEMAADPAWCSRIIDAPELVGVEAFLDSAVQLRLRMKVVPGAQWDVRREYLRRIKKAFDAAGIEIPFPHLTLYPGVPKEGAVPALNVKLVAAPAGQAAEATEKPIARDEHTAPPLE